MFRQLNKSYPCRSVIEGSHLQCKSEVLVVKMLSRPQGIIPKGPLGLVEESGRCPTEGPNGMSHSTYSPLPI